MTYFLGTSGSDTISGGLYDSDLIEGGDGNDNLDGGYDQYYDDFSSTAISAIPFSSFLADTIKGGGGDDYIIALSGDDFANGNAGNDTLYGALGDDTLRGGRDSDSINGAENDDFINGNKQADYVDGSFGNDIVHGGQGGDVVTGSIGSDIIFGDKGADTLWGFINSNQTFVDANSNTLNYTETNLSNSSAIFYISETIGGSTVIYQNIESIDLSQNDIFVFNAISGNDTIMDFQVAVDTIELRSTSLNSANVLNAVSYANGDALLTINDTTSVLLENVTSLSISDFEFV